MKWQIPAKTFLLGEYAALAGKSAIVLTTSPCFELSVINQEELIGIHPESPAGVWWRNQNHPGKGLSWYDPYNGLGGLGASSAQFLGSYLASCHLNHTKTDTDSMLKAYYQSSWSGVGLKPSGYDVIAQAQHGCVYINRETHKIHSYDWPFADLSCLLIHTGIKLATHHHLKEATLPRSIEHLSKIVDEAKIAFDQSNSKKIIDAINNYHNKLNELNLVAEHSLALIQELQMNSEILAIKGCGALGADVLLILTLRLNSATLQKKLQEQNWRIIATQEHLTINRGDYCSQIIGSQLKQPDH